MQILKEKREIDRRKEGRKNEGKGEGLEGGQGKRGRRGIEESQKRIGPTKI